MSIRSSFYITPLLIIALFLGGAVLEGATPKILNEDSVSDNGTVDIEWDKADDLEITLEQSKTAGFEETVIRYKGLDEGSVITGLPEGEHYFRVQGAGDGDWSETLVVTVEFFPKWKLFMILGIGAVVVLATIGTIIAGHLNTRGEEVEI